MVERRPGHSSPTWEPLQSRTILCQTDDADAVGGTPSLRSIGVGGWHSRRRPRARARRMHERLRPCARPLRANHGSARGDPWHDPGRQVFGDEVAKRVVVRIAPNEVEIAPCGVQVRVAEQVADGRQVSPHGERQGRRRVPEGDAVHRRPSPPMLELGELRERPERRQLLVACRGRASATACTVPAEERLDVTAAREPPVTAVCRIEERQKRRQDGAVCLDGSR